MNITKYNTLLDGTKIELVKEKTTRYSAQRLDNQETIMDCMNTVFQSNRQTEEYMWLLCFNSKLHLQGVFEVSHGTINGTVAEPAQIYKKALLCNANSIVLVHNHPSGDCTPSQDDIQITQRISKAGAILNIKLLDHLIIAGETYSSWKEGWS